MKEMMTITQAAKLLNVSEETIRRWVNSGNLPGIDILPGSSAVSPITTTPTVIPEPTPVYTANLALKYSRIASHIAENHTRQTLTPLAVTESVTVSETFTGQISPPMQNDPSQLITESDELTTDSDELSPVAIDELMRCMALLEDAAVALKVMINASLMTHDYIEVLDALNSDFMIMNVTDYS